MLNFLVLIMWLIILVVLHLLIMQFIHMKRLMKVIVQELKIQKDNTIVVTEKEIFVEDKQEEKKLDDMEEELFTYLTKNANEKLSTIPGIIDPFDNNNFEHAFNNGNYAMF